jgi:hypothetical protein
MHGWITDPRYVAYSKSMRKECSKLRKYAIDLLTSNSPKLEPVLFEGDSGVGKSEMAKRFANWLLTVELRNGLEPQQTSRLRRSNFIKNVPLNELAGRDQNARITLFGQGMPTTVQESERPSRVKAGMPAPGKPEKSGSQVAEDPSSELYNPGYVQRAHGGTLIFEEAGNADKALHSMLLNFLDTGIAKPEFPKPNAEDTKLDVLCLFTVQPAHMNENRILRDLLRRFNRGGHVRLLPLAERPKDVLPMFYESWLEKRQGKEGWHNEDDITEWLLPAARTWLAETVKNRKLSTQNLTQLVPDDDVIGVPSLKNMLEKLHQLPATQGPPTVNAQAQAHSAGAVPTAGFDLVRQLLQVARGIFPRDRQQLNGRLDEVKSAAARFVLEYLEACARVAMGGDGSVKLFPTYRLLTGTDSKGRTNTPKRVIKGLFRIDEAESVKAIQRSPILADLAKQVDFRQAKECQPLSEQLTEGRQAPTAPRDDLEEGASE